MTNTKTIKSSKSKDNKVIAEKDLPMSKVTEEVEVPYTVELPKSLKAMIHNNVRLYLINYDNITVSDAVNTIMVNTITSTMAFIDIQGSEYKRKRKCENILFNHITDIEQQSVDATLPYFNANYAGEKQYYLSQIDRMQVSDANYQAEQAVVADNRTEVKEIVDETTGQVRLESEQPVDLSKLARLQTQANNYRMIHNSAKAQYIVSRTMQLTLEMLYFNNSGKTKVETDASGKIVATTQLEPRIKYVHPPLAKEYARIEKERNIASSTTNTTQSIEDINKAYKDSQKEIL
tara:strand:+ start:181 stop:1053 length:873 start_codon:yes stop_codon:yes gene_type:complete